MSKSPTDGGSGPGRGKKECPSCHGFCGPRTLICPECSHIFMKKSAPVVDLKENAVVERVVRQILTPCGHPSVKLKGTDRESVLGWKKEINRKSLLEENAIYTDDALAYWIGAEFYPSYTAKGKNKDYVKATSHLEPTHGE